MNTDEQVDGDGGGVEAETAVAELPRLDPVEARVLACLVEKELTTPEYYPLTLRALTAACNQKSNRDPIMALDDDDVSAAIDVLRYTHHMAWHVSVAGSRVPKYRHALLERLTLTPGEVAVMCELMLRGPQTQGELRTHCQRLFAFASTDDVRTVLEGLKCWGDYELVAELPPGAGRREPRYAHLLCGREGLSDAGGVGGEQAESADTAPVPPREARIAALEEQVARLADELDELRSAFGDFRRQFE